MTIGERIRVSRRRANVTLEQLGAACGTSRQNIYKYENGIITNIPMDNLQIIANVLDVSPAYLMGWSDEEKAPAPKSEGIDIDSVLNSMTKEQLIQFIQKASELLAQ